MNLEFDDDQLELRDNVRSVLARSCPPSLVRAVHEGGEDGVGLWKQMVELDWPGIAIEEAHGGLGLTFVELALVVEELGRVVAPGPFLATVTQFAPLVAEAAGAEQRARLLAGVAAGTVTGTMAVAEGGRWSPSAVGTTARRHGAGWVVSGSKSYVFDGATVDEVAVIVREPGTTGTDGLGVVLVPAAAAAARRRDVLDPTVSLVDLTFDAVAVGPERVLLAPGDPAAPAAVRRALEVATAALSLSTVATCRAIFERTLQYAKDRHQFGRPIGSFQALKHRLAEMYLAVERANALAYFAVLTIAEDDPRRATATAMAKAAAGDCQRLLVRDGLQLHGGIGFTWEHDLHLWLKRAKTYEPVFGSSAEHRVALAEMLGLLT